MFDFIEYKYIYTYIFYKTHILRGTRSTKGYLDVFVRMCTKSLHLNLVANLTFAFFIGAFHRFACTTLVKYILDNANTFHRADAELRAIFREVRLDWDRELADLAFSGII